MAIGVRRVPTGSRAPGKPGTECVRPAILRVQPYEFQLAGPLGNRVVVDATGNAIPVTVT